MKCHITSGHFIALLIGESIKHIIFVENSGMAAECAFVDYVFCSL